MIPITFWKHCNHIGKVVAEPEVLIAMELSPTNDDIAAVDLSGGTKVQSRPHVLHKCKKKKSLGKHVQK